MAYAATKPAANGKAKKIPDTSGLTKRQRLDKLVGALWTDMTSMRSRWDTIGANILPSRPMWTASTSSQALPAFGNILDNTAGLALRTLSAGMVSGLSSPARPWFMLTTTDRALDEQADVGRWLSDVRDAILQVMDRANFYTEAETVYADAALFGTAAMAIEEDAETVIRCEAHPIGSYAIAHDSKRRANTFVREWACTAAQAAEAFGLGNLSAQSQQLVTDKNEQQRITIRHAIYPNPDWRPDSASAQAKNKRFAECYWEVGKSDVDEKFLREGGYDEFPLVVPRWGPLGAGKVWGDSSPGFMAIGPVLSLQEMRRQTWNALRKQVSPPTVSGPAWRNKTIYSIPGANNVEDTTQGDPTLKAMYQVAIPYAEIEATMEQVRGEIRDHFFQPYLTAMLTRLAEETEQPTAAQSYLARDEALAMFVSVIERFTDDFLDPAINRIFAIMLRRGMLPEPPQALQGRALTVQHISTMAQAQKSIGVTSIERHMLFVGQMAGMYGPPALDNTDADEVIREHAQATGVPPKGTRSPEETAQVRQARAQAQAAQQAAAAAPGLADAAKKLSETKLNQDSALDALANAGAGR